MAPSCRRYSAARTGVDPTCASPVLENISVNTPITPNSSATAATFARIFNLDIAVLVLLNRFMTGRTGRYLELDDQRATRRRRRERTPPPSSSSVTVAGSGTGCCERIAVRIERNDRLEAKRTEFGTGVDNHARKAIPPALSKDGAPTNPAAGPSPILI